MGQISWIKLKTEMFSDEKIRLIESMPEADSILIIWIKLLIQAGKCNGNGFIFLAENIPFSSEMLATLFNRPLTVVRLALKTLHDFNMISIDKKGLIYIENWDKHQNIEGMEKIKEQNRLRVQRFRDKQKQLNQPENDNSVTAGNVTVTEQNKSKIKNKKKSVRSGEIFEHELQIFCRGLKRVSNIPDQLTFEQCEKLIASYPIDKIKSKLEKLDNYKKVKDYNSVFLTIKTWLSDDTGKAGDTPTKSESWDLTSHE